MRQLGQRSIASKQSGWAWYWSIVLLFPGHCIWHLLSWCLCDSSACSDPLLTCACVAVLGSGPTLCATVCHVDGHSLQQGCLEAAALASWPGLLYCIRVPCFRLLQQHTAQPLHPFWGLVRWLSCGEVGILQALLVVLCSSNPHHPRQHILFLDRDLLLIVRLLGTSRIPHPDPADMQHGVGRALITPATS